MWVRAWALISERREYHRTEAVAAPAGDIAADGVSVVVKKVPCIRIDGRSRTQEARVLAEEAPVAIFVNGRHATTTTLSPVGLEEFVTGYLYTDEIESIKVDENRISVLTKNLFKRIGTKKTVLSGCGGSVSYIDTEKLPSIRSEATFSIEVIRAAIQDLLASVDRAETCSRDAVGLACDEGIVVRSEDIISDNALDRAIGYGLRNGIDFATTFAVNTACTSSEMIRKCLIADIPLIVSKNPPTALAVELAEETGLCVAESDGTVIAVYAHAERIEGI
jgi:FdhD protein